MLKRPGEVAARPQNESCSTLKWSSSTGQQPPLTRRHTNTRQNAVLQTLSEIRWKGSAPKRKADVRLHALSFYTRAAGRGARGETRTPTVIGLFC